MKFLPWSTSALLVSGIAVLFSCTNDKLELPQPSQLDCAQITITYVEHVLPILNSQCNTSGCHDGINLQPFGSYPTMNQLRRENIYNRACITKDMPPSGGLELGYIDTIRCWAEQGYLE